MYCHLQWDQGKIIRFGWTGDEKLAVLNEEGTYRLYDLQGDYQQYSLGSDAAEVGIIDARIHESGLVALTGSLSLLEVKGWDGGKPLTLASPGEHTATCERIGITVNYSSRDITTASCMGCHPSRLYDISTCRGPDISGRNRV